MELIKTFTAIQLSTRTTDDVVNIKLSFGVISGPFYSRDYPKEEFDTEQEAIEYAFKTEKYGRWLILPIIRFDNH